jgi:type II secretory pathway component PulF
VLRALSIGVEHRQTIQGTIQHLAANYPKYYIRARLERAGRLIDQGQAWYDGLASEGIIRRGEAALLQSAQRAGNLPWALNELADGAVRRLALRLRVWLDAIMPLIVLVLGALVLFIWVALFSPLVNMISDLSRINY